MLVALYARTSAADREAVEQILAAAWTKAPSIAAVARHLHASRSRVRSRLQEIGLLSQPECASASAKSLTNPATASEVFHE